MIFGKQHQLAGKFMFFASGANPNEIFYSVELSVLEESSLATDINYLDNSHLDVQYSSQFGVGY